MKKNKFKEVYKVFYKSNFFVKILKNIKYFYFKDIFSKKKYKLYFYILLSLVFIYFIIAGIKIYNEKSSKFVYQNYDEFYSSGEIPLISIRDFDSRYYEFIKNRGNLIYRISGQTAAIFKSGKKEAIRLEKGIIYTYETDISEPIRIIKANYIEIDDFIKMDKINLNGNVYIEDKNEKIKIECEKAIYDKNDGIFKASGFVRFYYKDKVSGSSKYLTYNENKKLIELNGNSYISYEHNYSSGEKIFVKKDSFEVFNGSIVYFDKNQNKYISIGDAIFVQQSQEYDDIVIIKGSFTFNNVNEREKENFNDNEKAESFEKDKKNDFSKIKFLKINGEKIKFRILYKSERKKDVENIKSEIFEGSASLTSKISKFFASGKYQFYDIYGGKLIFNFKNSSGYFNIYTENTKTDFEFKGNNGNLKYLVLKNNISSIFFKINDGFLIRKYKNNILSENYSDRSNFKSEEQNKFFLNDNKVKESFFKSIGKFLKFYGSNNGESFNYKFENAENFYIDEENDIFFKSKKGNFENDNFFELQGDSVIKDFKNLVMIKSDNLFYNFKNSLGNAKGNVFIFFLNKESLDLRKEKISELFEYNDFNGDKNYVNNINYFLRVIKCEEANFNNKTSEFILRKNIEIKDYSQKVYFKADFVEYSGKEDDIYTVKKNVLLKKFEDKILLFYNKKFEVVIEGDKGKIYRQKNYAFLTGDVKLLDKRENLFIQSEMIESYFLKKTYLFKNNVTFIYSNNEKNNIVKLMAKGDIGIYNYKEKTMNLKGNCFLNLNGSISKADYLSIDVKRGKITLKSIKETEIKNF